MPPLKKKISKALFQPISNSENSSSDSDQPILDDLTSDETFSSLKSDKTGEEQDSGKDLAKNDFILVKFLSVKSNEWFYIAQILKMKKNEEYNVKFLRASEQNKSYKTIIFIYNCFGFNDFFSFLQVMGQYFSPRLITSV